NGPMVGAQLLLAWAAEGGAPAGRIRQLLRKEDMPSEILAQLLEQILRLKQENKPLSPAELLSEYPQEEEAGRQIAAIYSKSLSPEREAGERAHILSANLQRLRKESIQKALRNNPNAEETRRLTKELGDLKKLRITEADL
ncbi:MAG: hypothetical protein J6H18_01570, partial [Lachnospiraceae bacterium]|nr:hypothetical protein [Lachnospiraceae bacterium]